MTKVLPANSTSIREAAAVLRGGGLVAFPTETVYGLGADAENLAAVRAMFAAKGRPADHPVIVHLAAADLLPEFAAQVPPEAWTLAEAFWPGPMTLVLRRSPRISDLVTGGLETVGLRVPEHPVARALLAEFGGPVAAPSANRFGRVSATRAEHVAEELAGRVDLILDGGACPVGLESTIIDVSSGRPAILRPGGVSAEDVERAIGAKLNSAASGPRVSGSLPSHYAPRARVEIVAANQLASRAEELASAGQRVAVISEQPLATSTDLIVAIPLPAEMEMQAQLLYDRLRQVDALGCDVVLVAVPTEEGIGAAIADRLRRAAGPR